MKFKKLLALVLACVLCFSAFSAAAPAAAAALDESDMSEVILQMKDRFDIDDSYTVFDYEYYNNGYGTVWDFNWSTEDYSKSIYVDCDAEGHTTYYSSYGPNSYSYGIPSKTVGESEKAALDWIYTVDSELKDKLLFTYSYFSYYSNSYSIYFNRIENGIEMPDNTVSITINANTDEVTNYYTSWNYDVEIPDAENIISKDEAAKILKSELKMNLEYFLGWDEEGKSKVFLAYTPDRSYISVDAKTGEIYTEKIYWNQTQAAGAATAESAVYDMGMDDNGASYKYRLSDAEKEKLADLENLISQEEAIAAIKGNEYLLVDENMNGSSCNLGYDDDGNYYWNVYLSDDRPYDYDNDDYYRAYANATVDARTGRIISYSTSPKTYWDRTEDELINLSTNYTKKQCREIFEKFAKLQESDKFDQVELSNQYDGYVLNYDYYDYRYTYGGFSYNYTRLYEGIPFRSNGFSGSVDAVTGKIYSYYCNWFDEELPSSADVIGADAACDSYLSFDGFDINYELVTSTTEYSDYYDSQNYARLVYVTDIYPQYVDANTGKQLNYNGQEITVEEDLPEYTDIAGSKYEREIILLASMGIGFEGEEYKPDQVITKDEFAKLLSQVSYISYFDSTTISVKGKGKLTRQAAARAVIEAFGMDEFSKMDIFKTGYSDEAKIKARNIGAVALCKGLGIMGAKSGKKFKPNAKVTRGEAADIIYKMLSSNMF